MIFDAPRRTPINEKLMKCNEIENPSRFQRNLQESYSRRLTVQEIHQKTLMKTLMKFSINEVLMKSRICRKTHGIWMILDRSRRTQINENINEV